jgi:hypothetical protein
MNLEYFSFWVDWAKSPKFDLILEFSLSMLALKSTFWGGQTQNRLKQAK